MSRALEDWAYQRGVQLDVFGRENPWKTPCGHDATGVCVSSRFALRYRPRGCESERRGLRAITARAMSDNHSSAVRRLSRTPLIRTTAITICLLAFGIHASAQTGVKPKPDAEASQRPRLDVTVSLSRESIREDANVDVRIWVANDSDQDVAAIQSSVVLPSFITWREATCDSWPRTKSDGPGDKPIAWGLLAAHSVTSKNLCLRSGSDVVVGDFNILFTFNYEWQHEKATRRSFTAVEKKLTVSLFGSDNIAGVPISLAGFIVPGLFFWMVLRLWKVPWIPWDSADVALGDRLIYSVLVSMLILLVGGKFQPTDVGAGVGLWKLFYLALVGAMAGVVVGGVDFLRRRWNTSQEQRQAVEADARSIKLHDDQEALLEKLLTDDAGLSRPAALVTLKDGSVFGGALARRDTSATGLVGWFDLELDGTSADVGHTVRHLVKTRQWNQALAMAKTHKLTLKVRNSIWKQVGDDREDQTYVHMTWDSAQVTNVDVHADEGTDDLISLP
jgi:hypothetical protein